MSAYGFWGVNHSTLNQVTTKAGKCEQRERDRAITGLALLNLSVQMARLHPLTEKFRAPFQLGVGLGMVSTHYCEKNYSWDTPYLIGFSHIARGAIDILVPNGELVNRYLDVPATLYNLCADLAMDSYGHPQPFGIILLMGVECGLSFFFWANASRS